MKSIYKLLAVCTIIVSSYATNAQVTTSTRQNLFSRYSDKLPTAITELEKAFNAKPGTEVKLMFSDFSFTGIITSSLKRYDNLYSVVITSASLNNTLFSISKRVNDDKTITYVGRIINEKYADGFELEKDSGGNYALNKIKTEDLLQDY